MLGPLSAEDSEREPGGAGTVVRAVRLRTGLHLRPSRAGSLRLRGSGSRDRMALATTVAGKVLVRSLNVELSVDQIYRASPVR
jgi:hypothetical protein